MRIERVADRGDPRLHEFLDLRDTQMRVTREQAEGFFLAEGDSTIRRALAAGYEPRGIVATERWLETLADIDTVAYAVPGEVLESTTGFPVHRGALASFTRRPLTTVASVLAPAHRVAVLEDLVDHTNVGAIFRSAAALGWDAVLVTTRCGDPLYRRAVRTSMGAVFTVPWTRLDHRAGLAELGAAGFTRVALTPDVDAPPVERLGMSDRVALLIGSEGPGLSVSWLAAADARVRIPMHAGIDSLNVAAAAAIALYVAGRPSAEG
jgi:tRNA G18 (ribose-2'-O)-methylase SpoU